MSEQYLAHYGVLGMKWGRRKARIDRYQNKDGSITSDGKKRYGKRGTLSPRYQKDRIKFEKENPDYKALKDELNSKHGNATTAQKRAFKKYTDYTEKYSNKLYDALVSDKSGKTEDRYKKNKR